MPAQRRLYISCAEEDRPHWLALMKLVWAPRLRDGQLELWTRQNDDDAGEPIPCHGALVIATAAYIADDGLMAGELVRLVADHQPRNAFFWLPVGDCLFEDTPLGALSQAHGPTADREKIEGLSETDHAAHKKALLAVAQNSHFKELPETAARSASQAMGLRGGGGWEVQRIVPAPVERIRKPKRTSREGFLISLIDRGKHEDLVEDFFDPGAANPRARTMMILPAPHREAPDRFATRLDEVTVGALAEKLGPSAQLKFDDPQWPSRNDGDSADELFTCYLDGVVKRIRPGGPEWRKGGGLAEDAFQAVKNVVTRTHFIIWVEVATTAPEDLDRELMARAAAFWRLFAEAGGAIKRPLAIHALPASGAEIAAYGPAEGWPAHVMIADQLSSILRQDMTNWLKEAEVKAACRRLSLSDKINLLFSQPPDRGPANLEPEKRIPLAEIARHVEGWLGDATQPETRP
jgi:hypothetical protein